MAVVLAGAGFVWQARRSAQPAGSAYKPSSNKEANDLFSLAMQFQTGQNDLPKAQDVLERALTLDPHFAEALGCHAFNYALEILNGFVNDTNLLYKAEEELGRAAPRRAQPLMTFPARWRRFTDARAERAGTCPLAQALAHHPLGCRGAPLARDL